MASGTIPQPYATEFIKLSTVATGQNGTGYHFAFTAPTSFVCFYFDNAGRVALIIKTANYAATITELHGTFSAKNADTTDVYINAGAWCRASFQMVSAVLDSVDISTY